MKTRTYAMIKPDAFAAGYVDVILKRIGAEGFTIVAKKEMTFSRELAEKFYAEHKERPFFGELVSFICSGPLVALVLEKEDAVTAWRTLIGSTNPANAAENTLRKLYGASTGNNAVHGSDAPATADREIALVFPELA